MNINEVIVVEGNHDLAKLKAVDSRLDVMITNGSSVSEETKRLLKKLNEQRGLILMLDPDAPGEKIRKEINAFVGHTKHIFLQKNKCIDNIKQKVGIEHASLTDIKEALLNHVVELKKPDALWTMQMLVKLNLTGTVEAKKRRLKVSEALKIGHCNAKTFMHRLNMLEVSELELLKVIK